MTSLTVDKFAALVPPFEAAFLDYMATWTLHGRRRQARRYTTDENCPLPTPEDRLLFILVYLKQNPTPLLHGRLFGMRQSKATPMDSCLPARLARHAADLGGCALSPCGGLARTPGGGRTSPAVRSLSRGSGPSGDTSCGPPFCHDGTERPIPRPHDATEQKACYSGKKKRHMLKNLLLINRAVRILFLSETHPGRVHDKCIADTTPYPLPAGSRLLQDLGFQAFTLEGVEILQPAKKPRGKALTRAQKAGNRTLARRRVRIEHVNSSVKRCRRLKETIRLWKAGIHDMVMEIGCALHNFRVRLTPSWTPLA